MLFFNVRYFGLGTSSTPSLPRTPWGLRFVFIAGGFDAHRRRVRAGGTQSTGWGWVCKRVWASVFHSTVAVEGERGTAAAPQRRPLPSGSKTKRAE
jgi:hypothetical protein